MTCKGGQTLSRAQNDAGLALQACTGPRFEAPVYQNAFGQAVTTGGNCETAQKGDACAGHAARSLRQAKARTMLRQSAGVLLASRSLLGGRAAVRL